MRDSSRRAVRARRRGRRVGVGAERVGVGEWARREARSWRV